jgi:hypothetical protein
MLIELSSMLAITMQHLPAFSSLPKVRGRVTYESTFAFLQQIILNITNYLWEPGKKLDALVLALTRSLNSLALI